MAFFDSGTSHYLILDSFSALHSILVCIDASRGISKASGVVITYIIRWTVLLHEERLYETIFHIQDFCQTELWYFLFYYSSSDHDFFYQVHGTRVFSELICSQVII